MKPETSGKVKFGVWGLIIGAVIVMIIGFVWGGWLTGGTAQKMTDEAVLASQAAICVAQFMKQPNHEEKLKELEKVESWKRSEFIEKGGWDKMPGQEKAGSYVAQACAKGLEVLVSK
jgi:nucleoid-associated protein YgaU